MVDRSQKSSSCTLCAVVKLHGCLHRVVICELTFAFDLVQSNDCARCRGLGVRDASRCVHCTLKKTWVFLPWNWKQLFKVTHPTAMETKHLTFLPRSKMMSFCFQQPAVASSNTSPKDERPRCVGISTSSVHFPGASQGQWSEFDVAARRLCRCSSTVTVAAVAARGNVSLQTPTWKRLTAKQRWSKTSRWVMHQSFGTFGSEKLMQCQRFVDVDFIVFQLVFHRGLHMGVLRCWCWGFFVRIWQQSVTSETLLRTENLRNWPNFFPRFWISDTNFEFFSAVVLYLSFGHGPGPGR